MQNKTKNSNALSTRIDPAILLRIYRYFKENPNKSFLVFNVTRACGQTVNAQTKSYVNLLCALGLIREDTHYAKRKSSKCAYCLNGRKNKDFENFIKDNFIVFNEEVVNKWDDQIDLVRNCSPEFKKRIKKILAEEEARKNE